MNNSAVMQTLDGAFFGDTEQETESPVLLGDYKRFSQAPAHDSTQNENGPDSEASRGLSGQNEERPDIGKLVAPWSARKSQGFPASGARSFNPTMEWEGYVENIGEADFVVRMVNVKSGDALPADMATFSMDDLSEYDKGLLREGAIVRWVLGLERLPSGQKRRVSELYFRRLPAHSAADFARARAKARKLIDSIHWDESARAK